MKILIKTKKQKRKIYLNNKIALTYEALESQTIEAKSSKIVTNLYMALMKLCYCQVVACSGEKYSISCLY